MNVITDTIKYLKPNNGFARIAYNPAVPNSLIDSVNRRAELISEFRLFHAMKTDAQRFRSICAARGIDPESVVPPFHEIPDDYRDWVRLSKIAAK